MYELIFITIAAVSLALGFYYRALSEELEREIEELIDNNNNEE